MAIAAARGLVGGALADVVRAAGVHPEPGR